MKTVDLSSGYNLKANQYVNWMNHLLLFEVHLLSFGLSNMLPLPILLKTVINANSMTPVNKVTNHVNSPKNLNKEKYRTVFTTQTAVPIMLNRVYL